MGPESSRQSGQNLKSGSRFRDSFADVGVYIGTIQGAPICANPDFCKLYVSYS